MRINQLSFLSFSFWAPFSPLYKEKKVQINYAFRAMSRYQSIFAKSVSGRVLGTGRRIRSV